MPYIETMPTEFIAEMIRLFNAELAKRGETLEEVTQLPTIDKEVMVPIGTYRFHASLNANQGSTLAQTADLW